MTGGASRRCPDGPAGGHRHRRRFLLRADAVGAGAWGFAVSLRGGGPQLVRRAAVDGGAPGDRPARPGRPLSLRRGDQDRSRRRHRRRADAAGPAVRPRLHHRHAPAGADRRSDAGRQRPCERPQRAGEGLRPRLRAVHAADAGDAVAGRGAGGSWRRTARSSSSRSTATAARRSSRSAATAPTCRR